MPSVLLFLAEDDHAVADVSSATLAGAGDQVIAASNGHEAIKEVEMDASRSRAIVTDIAAIPNLIEVADMSLSSSDGAS